jgi:hypothetical protein
VIAYLVTATGRVSVSFITGVLVADGMVAVRSSSGNFAGLPTSDGLT